MKTSDKHIRITTDFDRPSFVRVGELYAKTLQKIGYKVDHVAVGNREHDFESGLINIQNSWGTNFRTIPGALNIALVVHEWSRYPPMWVPILNEFDEIWVTTSHVKELLEASGIEITVVWMPPAVDLENSLQKKDWQAGKPFRFLFVGEHHFRKGLHLLLEGWKLAFPESGIAHLTIKTSPGFSSPTYNKDIVVIEDYLSRDTLQQIMIEHDAYVSTSLAEGWGIPIVEAIQAGLPVLTHFWGGHRSLLCQDSEIALRHREILQPYASKPELFAPGQHCAWVDPDEIARGLRSTFVTSAKDRHELNAKDQAFLMKNYSWNTVAGKIEDRLKILGQISN